MLFFVYDRHMKILAIETSCDESGISLIDATHTNGEVSINVLADSLLSQALLHAEYGGVYPSLAKREHAKNLTPLLIEVLKQSNEFEEVQTSDVPQEKIKEIQELLVRESELFTQLALLLAQIKKPEIDAIAVTHGPGLEPALWVGVNFAKALSIAWDIPVMPMNHMEGHVAAALAVETTENTYTLEAPKLSTLILLISGGHTELVLMKEWSPAVYEKIGSTRDDAAGEAFDKSARLIGLAYPGGPKIAKLAQEAREENLDQPYSLPRPMLKTDDYDFSFSGLKTAVRTLVQKIENPTDEQKKQIAREVEDSITDVLIYKTKRAIEEFGIQSLIVGGGVSANTNIRSSLEALTQEYSDFTLYIPEHELSTDNGRMIAFAAALHGVPADSLDDIVASGNLSL